VDHTELDGVRFARKGGRKLQRKGKENRVKLMREILALGVAFLFYSSAAKAIEPVSANELLQACGTLERTMTIAGGKFSFPETPSNDECWYFMGAVQQYSTIRTPEGGRLLNACPGETTTLTQLIRIFTNYASSHPEQLNEMAIVVAVTALQSSFPCN
jgi:hypothetical protein